MNDLNEIYQMEPPFNLRVNPVGKAAVLSVHSNDMSISLELKSIVPGIPNEKIDSAHLSLSSLKKGVYEGTATVFKDDFLSYNEKLYNQSCVCISNPQQMVANFIRRGCENLSFYKDEIIHCSSLFVVIKALSNLINSGVFLKEFHLNDKVFNVENMKVLASTGMEGTPLVTSGGIVKRTVALYTEHNGIKTGTVTIGKDQKAQHYMQEMILFDEFLLVDKEPKANKPLTECPACSSDLVEVDGLWNCTSVDCHPFLEAFLASISVQSGISVDRLRDQYKLNEKFHYDIQSTIEEQAREEIPVDCLRTYFDILKMDGLHGIMERFFGLYNQQLHCSKAGAIDEMFYNFLTFGNTNQKLHTRPVVYYPPLNSKPKVLAIGGFDGLSEQTLELKLAEIGIGTTSVVQEADLVIAGNINGNDEEFYHYVKEVSNILIIETQGSIHEIFYLMKYF